jgi:glutathione S-transferase
MVLAERQAESVPERTLVILRYSPWSERARWALDHHRLPYHTLQHEPFLGERRLRRLAGKRTGRVTVPILLIGGDVLTDSWDIVRYADREGVSEKLIPADLEGEIRHLTDLADRAMEQNRALIVAGMLKSGAALDEVLPAWVPSLLRPLLRPVTRFGTGWFGRKYQVRLHESEAQRQFLRGSLLDFRRRLADGGYLLDRFSYADIALASLLQGISPVYDRYIAIGPATREVWTQPELAREFDDLVHWRDRLYAERRGPSPS